MKLLSNIEFYNTPTGEVMVSEQNMPIRQLSENDTEFIAELIDIINARYPEAFKRLSETYVKSKANLNYFNFRMVRRFIRCNMGEYDTQKMDIDSDGVFQFEQVKCPLRGECKDECIICKPKLQTLLTDREKEVLELIAKNYEMTEIADMLSLSVATINRHRENIKARLGKRNVKELITYYYQHLNQ